MKKYLLPKAGGINVLFSHSGRHVLYWNDQQIKNFSLGIGNKFNLWDLAEDKKIMNKKVSGFRVWTATFLPDENYILIANNKGLIKKFSLQKSEVTDTWEANVSNKRNGRKSKVEIDKIIMPEQAANYIGIHGKFYDDWALKIFKFPEMILERVVINPDFIDTNWPAAFSNDGRYLVVSDKGSLSLYSTNDWKCLWRVPIRTVNQKFKRNYEDLR
jgi:WD40 repeat protein